MVQENVVTNNIVWDGNVNTWQPPSDAIMLIDAQTPAMIWYRDDAIKDFVLVEVMGAGDIGFTWNGSVLTTNEPKPEYVEPVQPESTGTQTL